MYFSLVAKFHTKNAASTPLKNNASVQQPASHQDKKQLSSEDKQINKPPSRTNEAKEKETPAQMARDCARETCQICQTVKS